MISQSLSLYLISHLLWKFYHSPGNSLHLSDIGAALANNSANLELKD